MVKTKTSLKRLIEDILRDYPNVEKYIRDREEELKYPTREPDENVGGGKGSKISRPQEQMIITLDQDRRLNKLKWQRDTIEDCFNNADEDTRNIIRELYFKKYPTYRIEGLVQNHIVNCDRSTAFRLRNKFIEDVSKELHIYTY